MQTQISRFKQELIDYSDIPSFQIDRIFEITTINKTIEICIQNKFGIRDFKRVENEGKIKITEESL
jgi:hypothetical protein